MTDRKKNIIFFTLQTGKSSRAELNGVWSMDRCNSASLTDRSWGNGNCGYIPDKKSKQKISLRSATVWSPQLPLPLLLLPVLGENTNIMVLTSVPGIFSLLFGDPPSTWGCWKEVASFGNTFSAVIFLCLHRLWFMYHSYSLCILRQQLYSTCLMPGKQFLCGIHLNISLCFCTKCLEF